MGESAGPAIGPVPVNCAAAAGMAPGKAIGPGTATPVVGPLAMIGLPALQCLSFQFRRRCQRYVFKTIERRNCDQLGMDRCVRWDFFQ